MARPIPVYQRQIIADAVQNAPRASSNMSEDNPAARALQGLGSELEQLSNVMMDKHRKQQEDDAAITVANTLSQGEVYWQEEFQRRTQSWKVGDPDMREGIGTDFDSWVSESEQALPTDASKQFFRQNAIRMRTRLETGAFQYQTNATTEKLNADTQVGIDADANVVYSDPTRLDEVYARRAETIVARNDLSEADKIKAASTYRQSLYFASERGQMERDPVGWYRQRFGEFQLDQPQATPQQPAQKPSAMAVANAIYGQESSSGRADTSAVNAQGVTGPMQVMGSTFEGMKKLGIIPQEYDWRNPAHNKEAGFRWVAYLHEKYDGDPAKIAAAYYGGEKAVSSDGTIKRDMKNLSRPNDPTVGEYVDSVLSRMGQAPTQMADAGTTQTDAVQEPTVVAPKTFSGLDWERQSQLRSQAETRIRQGNAMLKAEADTAVNDAVAMHKNGIVDPVPIEFNVFQQAYGASAQSRYDAYIASRQMGEDIGAYKTMPLSEIVSEVESTAPMPGPGYAASQQRYQIRAQAAAQIVKMRNQNPVAYAVENSPHLARQRQELDNPNLPEDFRPAFLKKYVTDLLAEQRRLGIADPRILSLQQSDMISRQAMSATRPEDSANLISGLESEYGEYFPQVFNELVRDNKISGELLIIPNLPTQTAREAVSRLARVKEADLTQGIDAATQKSVKDEVVSRLGDLARTVPLLSEQSANVLNAYEGSMRKLAYQLVSAGMNPVDAADQSFEMLLGHYQMDGTARFPKGIDPDVMLRGANGKIFESLADIDVPADIAGGRNQEEVRPIWEEMIRSNPVWHTTDDDSGLSLWVKGQNGVVYRVSSNGEPVSFTWEELQAQEVVTRNLPATNVREALQRGDMETFRRLREQQQLERVRRATQ